MNVKWETLPAAAVGREMNIKEVIQMVHLL